MMVSRRKFLSGLGSVGICSWLASTHRLNAQDLAEQARQCFRIWREDLARIQDEVRRKGWDYVALECAPPASEDALRHLESVHGIELPPQLRAVLRYCSASVRFGWSIPKLLQPFEGMDLPMSGGMLDHLWDLDQIADMAITPFNASRHTPIDPKHLEEGKVPDPPGTWEHHFPFASLPAGDALTIDVSSPQGLQPIRYFSAIQADLHRKLIAPDFFGFVSTYVRLGCAGDDDNDWSAFIDFSEGEVRLIDSESEGGRRWRGWRAHHPQDKDPDQPPPAIAAKTKSDFYLLDAAHQGCLYGVEMALAAGAVPDCVAPTEPDRDAWYDTEGQEMARAAGPVLDCAAPTKPDRDASYDTEFETALVFAIRRNDSKIIERLVGAGASLNTRRLASREAVRTGSLEVLRWLLNHGARPNGWKGERYGPLHDLIIRSGNKPPGGEAAARPRVEALLGAGADPNASAADGRTPLMDSGPELAKILLEHGADPNHFDNVGLTALHLARSATMVRLLARHGADLNILSRPRPHSLDDPAPHTPFQALLRIADPHGPSRDAVDALVEAGADPLKRDGFGRSILWYCNTLADARRFVQGGCDPKEPGSKRTTLLHELVVSYGPDMGKKPDSMEIFQYYQSFGIDINARDDAGMTVLHFAALHGKAEAIQFLCKQGADKTLRDKAGRLPFDLTESPDRAVRDLLRL